MEMAVEDRREQSYLTFPKNTELDVKECAKAGLFYNGKCKSTQNKIEKVGKTNYQNYSESLYRYINSFSFPSHTS